MVAAGETMIMNLFSLFASRGLCEAPEWYVGKCPPKLATGADEFSHQDRSFGVGGWLRILVQHLFARELT